MYRGRAVFRLNNLNVSSQLSSVPVVGNYMCQCVFMHERLYLYLLFLAGGGVRGAGSRWASPGGTQDPALQSELFQPTGLHPGHPPVPLEHQTFYHLPGAVLINMDARSV